MTEQAVSAVVNVIKGWNDPFAEENVLVITSTGKLATADVRRDLMNALKVGEINMKPLGWRDSKAFLLQGNFLIVWDNLNLKHSVQCA